jgi:hypothetical protein
MTQRRCDKCEWWEALGDNPDDCVTGWCRISRPTFCGLVGWTDLAPEDAAWPHVIMDDWCGEFTLKTEKAGEAG